MLIGCQGCDDCIQRQFANFRLPENFESVRNKLRSKLFERADAICPFGYIDVVELSGFKRSEGEPSECIGIKRSDGIARRICTVKCDKSALDRLVTGIYNGACKGRALLWGKEKRLYEQFRVRMASRKMIVRDS